MSTTIPAEATTVEGAPTTPIVEPRMSSRFVAWLAALTLLGFVVRVLNVLWWRPTTDTPGYHGYRLWGDAFYYHWQANALAHGAWYVDLGARIGPVKATVVTTVCTVKPRMPYHFPPVQRASSALIARVAPYAPGLAEATGITRTPISVKRCALSVAQSVNLAAAPGRSSYSVSQEISTSSPAVVVTVKVSVSPVNRRMRTDASVPITWALVTIVSGRTKNPVPRPRDVSICTTAGLTRATRSSSDMVPASADTTAADGIARSSRAAGSGAAAIGPSLVGGDSCTRMEAGPSFN